MRHWIASREIVGHPHREKYGVGFSPERATQNLTSP
jgi:hypothetical protein